MCLFFFFFIDMLFLARSLGEKERSNAEKERLRVTMCSTIIQNACNSFQVFDPTKGSRGGSLGFQKGMSVHDSGTRSRTIKPPFNPLVTLATPNLPLFTHLHYLTFRHFLWTAIYLFSSLKLGLWSETSSFLTS